MKDPYEKLLNRLKANNPMFDLEVEFGQLLMKHIDNFTPVERARYDELQIILTNHRKNHERNNS